MLEKLTDFICEYLSIDADKITPDTNFRTDMQLDSLTLIGLVVAIENEFDIEISEDDLERLNTVGDLMEYVKAHEENCD